MALGATRRNVLWMVIGRVMALTGAGLLIGLAGALALTRLMKTLLFGVSATDPLTFAVISLLLTAVALLAASSRRGGRRRLIRCAPDKDIGSTFGGSALEPIYGAYCR